MNSTTIFFDEELKAQWKHAFEQARRQRDRYFVTIKSYIDEAIDKINQFDKIYVLGGLGAKLLNSTPNAYSIFLENYEGSDKVEAEEEKIQVDDDIEVLLEYAMSIATASPNENEGVLPTQKNIDEIYDLLLKIKINVNFYDQSADIPEDGDEFDHWLRTMVMVDTMNVRGDGYSPHIEEVFLEIFNLHNEFLRQFYGFEANDLLDVVTKLERLVYSKIGNTLGAKECHARFVEWTENKSEKQILETMSTLGKHFIQQFIEDNPDLTYENENNGIVFFTLDDIEAYSKIYWVIPKTRIEEKVFEALSQNFGDNSQFFQPEKFKAFPLGDTLVQTKPLIKFKDKYYYFSTNVAFRNLFKIGERLIEIADPTYYQHTFRGNSSAISRDNYLEAKTKALFEKMLPTTKFYRSVKYKLVENGLEKSPELDVIGIASDTVYIIEVKAGQLHAKHRRGAIKGLKDRLSETVNEGAYQCHRALKYISENENPEFSYTEAGKLQKLLINKAGIENFFKISVSFEHFGAISANLKYLINSGVLAPAYKWSWLISIFDLMVFADLIESKEDFTDYLQHRLNLYERDDVEFLDEIDVLGFFFENKFPLPRENKEKAQTELIVGFKGNIDKYFSEMSVGLPNLIKPRRKK